MKAWIVIFLCSAISACGQIFGFTPQQIQYLDTRYARTGDLAAATGLTTNTIFGASGNVMGFYDTLTYTETDPFFSLWASTNTPISQVTADETTITNNGSGQFSVPLYDSNAFARVAYRMNTRRSWTDFEPGNINDTDFGEAVAGGPLEFDWSDLE